MSNVQGPQPLAGLKIVEFVHMVMGPSCGLVLADLGADVIKVEPVPAGDNTRRLGASGAGFFATFNRNKRSLAIDMKSPEGLAIVRQLVADADVVTENFRPGAMDKLGLGYDELSKTNPKLVYCSLKGFLDGPYEHRTALDEVVQMMAGLAYMTGPAGRPLRAGTSVNDIMGGMFAAIGILAAIHERQTTGKGRYVKSALFENCAFLMAQHVAQYCVTGVAPPPMAVRRAAWGVYDVFDTADGDQLFLAVVSDTQWGPFCDEFSLAELKADPALATNNQRCAARDTMLPVIQAAAKKCTKAELLAKAEKLGIPYAPIGKPVDLLDDPHLIASGGLAEVTNPDGKKVRIPALPISFDGERLPIRRDLPGIGADGGGILRELGIAPAEIERLIASGVVKVETPNNR
ncbi:MAG: CoA transferase [Proteobacteria bacterium]|nr:CoA transferase [Pseudomonadota bacterium]